MRFAEVRRRNEDGTRKISKMKEEERLVVGRGEEAVEVTWVSAIIAC